MTKSKREQEREWAVRKQNQQEHGKIKSFKDLSTGNEQNNLK